ncbi:MAG TPA: hypothetical protein VIK60_00200 [Vicinamibacterales bacterium]
MVHVRRRDCRGSDGLRYAALDGQWSRINGTITLSCDDPIGDSICLVFQRIVARAYRKLGL